MSAPSRLLQAKTADGLTLAVRHVPGAGRPGRGAVLLLHGLGSNGLAFDYPGRSLAGRLSELGFDCFVCALRGAGASQTPKGAYGLDAYIEQDLPALIATVLDASGEARLQWVGHSMGGILALLYGMEHPQAPISRVVTIGSALDYRVGHSVYRDLRRARPLAGSWLPTLPFRFLSRLNGVVAGYGPAFPAESMNFARGNVEPRVLRDVLWSGFTPIPFRLFDDLATTFDADGLKRKGGSVVYQSLLSAYPFDTLLLAGSGDPQCSEAAVRHTAELLTGAARTRVCCFGTAHGQVADYGHFDLIIGRRAETEVWPVLEAYLSGQEVGT